MTKKESAAKSKEAAAEPKSLEELILNYAGRKYEAIPMAAQWAKVLRKREENRHLTPTEVLELALKEVLGGEVGWKEIKKALAAAAANGAAESALTFNGAADKKR